jgi:hypothetical protein
LEQSKQKDQEESRNKKIRRKGGKIGRGGER